MTVWIWNLYCGKHLLGNTPQGMQQNKSINFQNIGEKYKVSTQRGQVMMNSSSMFCYEKNSIHIHLFDSKGESVGNGSISACILFIITCWHHISCSRCVWHYTIHLMTLWQQLQMCVAFHYYYWHHESFSRYDGITIVFINFIFRMNCQLVLFL